MNDNVMQKMRNPVRVQSRGEEFANYISHGISLLAVLIGTPFLIISAKEQSSLQLLGTMVFSASAIFLYLSSTIYHALPAGGNKHRWRMIEHSAIFVLIAGTYTPFTLGILNGALGWTLFGLIWGLAALGVSLKIFQRQSHPIVSTCLYLLMGWLILLATDPLLMLMPLNGLIWLLAGGLFYTLGVIFFATDSRLYYGHFIWHLFVMGGTTCHYFAVLWYAN